LGKKIIKKYSIIPFVGVSISRNHRSTIAVLGYKRKDIDRGEQRIQIL
jgi:hypothetical protein